MQAAAVALSLSLSLSVPFFISTGSKKRLAGRTHTHTHTRWSRQKKCWKKNPRMVKEEERTRNNGMLFFLSLSLHVRRGRRHFFPFPKVGEKSVVSMEVRAALLYSWYDGAKARRKYYIHTFYVHTRTCLLMHERVKIN